ncbi:TPA: hypothetical protein N0F65_012652 [Lagenidium giganteum]|uniref:Uncharacterized protein n=1 Tax=Lagenidium giganteum TaxID=4803 RepID=A0AAV2YLG1_9STRA|nr:TPA: hypothetical protein N0F65_012652 [Lagenidium giganteum]
MPTLPLHDPVQSPARKNQHQILQIQRMKVAKKNPNDPVRNPLVMVIMLFVGLLLVLFIMAFFAYAPLLCATWLGIMHVIGLYLTTESKWWWHDAQEFENRFWTVTAFLFSTAVLYIKDSPLAVGRWNSSLGMLLVTSFTAGVHFFDRFIHRKAISRKPRLNQSKSMCQNLFKYKATAEEKTKLVSECVSRIDRMLLPSTINNMLNLPQVRRQEQKIFRILAGASKDELNFMLNNIRLALLFYKVKDHSKEPSDQSRTLILDLLCTKRLADLTVTSRALLLDALMVMKLSAHPKSEKWVRNIILKTSGDDLSNLKTFTDAKGDFHSMHKLVFSDIRDPSIRNDILNHIKREAGVQTAHMRLGTKRAMKRRLQAWRKVLSDVDDTLYSSGGRYPAGVDSRYPSHALYPGVLPFYRELDMGTTGSDEWTDDRVGNLVFLSARPHVYKDMAEKKSYAKFAAFHEKQGMHTLPTMLAGSLKSGSAFMLEGDLEPMAQKKFENFCEYYQLYPEFRHVFIGDNGQGDVRAAELIVEKFGSDALEAGYFHLVQPIEKTFGLRSLDDIERWRKMNIVFFNTYVGAAVQAYKLKQIRLCGLKKICESATKSFVEMEGWPTPGDRERIRMLVNADLEAANALFGKAFDPLPLVTKPQVFALNSQVRTPFGQGIVRKYRGIDGIYHVELVDWTMCNRKRAVGFFPQESLMPYVKDDTTKMTKSELKYVKYKKAPLARIFAPQTLVRTPFGNGRVVRFRPKDEVYVVTIDGQGTMMNLTGYFAPDAIVAVKTDNDPNGSSPRILSGVRSGIGYITKKLSTFVPSSSGGIRPLHAIGATVDSPFGRAIVVRFRATDRVYEVQLLRTELSGGGVFVQEKALKESSVSPSRSFFSIWGLSSTSGKPANAPAAPSLAEGTSVVTPYGKGVIRKYRECDQIYEIVLTDWSLAKSQQVIVYLVKSLVQQAMSSMEDVPPLALSNKGVYTPPSSSSLGLFQLFRYGFNSNSSAEVVAVPYADDGAGRRVTTVFGQGLTPMSKPHNGVLKVFMEEANLNGVVAFVQADGVTDIPRHQRRNTLELFGNPFNYLRGSWIASGTESDEFVLAAAAAAAACRQVFANGALVATPFGDGIVNHYREADSVYEVQLGAVKGFFQPKSLGHPVRGELGLPVSTSFGSGVLRELRVDDGVHVVQLRHALHPSVAITAFLQPSSVHGILKACRGDVVTTPFGRGVVLNHRVSDGFYCVALEWDLNGRSHVSAFIRPEDVARLDSAEKVHSGCVVM